MPESIERAHCHRGHKQYQGESPVRTRPYVQSPHGEKNGYIGDGEPSWGERGERPKRTTYPEPAATHTGGLRVIHEREKTFFRVGPEEREAQAETVIPYWEERSMRYRLFSQMSQS